jgi:DNA-binding IclR family transcriptional regulator
MSSAKTPDRVLGVLNLFAGEADEWTVEAAASTLGIPVSTAYRYFKTLAQFGLLSAFAPGRYVLGPAIIQLDRHMRLSDPLIVTAQPIMADLAAALGPGHVVFVARLYRSMVMCVHQEWAERGRPMPLDRGASSKAILAFLPPRVLRQLLGDRPESSTEELRRELRRVRALGYSVTYGEVDPGMRGISVPIFLPDNILTGSLSVAAPGTVMSDDRLRHSIELLIRAGKMLEAGLAIRAASLPGRPDDSMT